MKPIAQTIFTTPDQSIHGNCFSACVASLLELPLDAVPTFETMGQRWAGVLYEFLFSQGYNFQGTFYTKSYFNWWDELTQHSDGVDGYYIVEGNSPRAYVLRGHAVIYRDGAVVHDPHASAAGLATVENVLMIERRTAPPGDG